MYVLLNFTDRLAIIVFAFYFLVVKFIIIIPRYILAKQKLLSIILLKTIYKNFINPISFVLRIQLN